MFSSILIFILVLSVLVLVHEAGHFFVAKKSGVWVEEFGFGLPPRLIGKKVGETIYSVNLLPFGGFVRLHGENSEDEISKPTRSFLGKSRLTRSKIIVAGVVMNFLLAICAFSLVYSFSGIPIDTGRVKVVDVTAQSPAHESKILVGDVIEKINGKEVSKTEEFSNETESNKGKKVKLDIIRGEENISVSLVPRVEYPSDQGPIGVTISTTEIYFPPIWQRPFYGIYYGFKDAIFWGKAVLGGLGMIVAELFRGSVPKDVAGPVGIYALTSEAAKVGILALVNFVGILSVNLAILNIIPFPAMDGGRLLFIGIESVLGKRVLPKLEAVTHAVGMLLLILLLLVITFADVKRLITNGGIDGFVNSFLNSGR